MQINNDGSPEQSGPIGAAAWRAARHFLRPLLSLGQKGLGDSVCALERDLRDAIANEQLLLNYQPIVETGNRRLAGFEALIRWRHPEWGMIQPAQFIAMAEETGLILPIGQWVVCEAIRQLAEWRREENRDLWVAVNVSVRQIEQDERFGETVCRALSAFGVPARCLKLEITESVMESDLQMIAERLGALSRLGISLAMDDFGTGHSSLCRLLHLPFDTLKIDRCFVSLVETDQRARGIFEAMGGIAQRLGMEVVAEGIETWDELAMAARTGCRYSQGYMFAEPLSACGAATLLKDGSPMPIPGGRELPLTFSFGR